MIRRLTLAALAALVCLAMPVRAQVMPSSVPVSLLVEARTGQVLHEENATHPWHPASVTKLMTAYVVLAAIREGRIKPESLFTVSEEAMAQSPSKMGFKVGTQVTVDNALKMLMVKSANDIAVLLAEGVGGSVDGFSEMMNRHARRLGMSQSNFVNPNGLPDDRQVTSARDMAILARALYGEFPEWEFLWHIPAIKLGKIMMRNHNHLLGRYPGADGMKTGFICASGFNVVATATRGGRRLIAVIMGAPNARTRAEAAARLFERGFEGGGLDFFRPQAGAVESLRPMAASPPNLREDVCGKNRKSVAESEEIEVPVPNRADPTSPRAAFVSPQKMSVTRASLLGPYVSPGPAVMVHVGPARKLAGDEIAVKPAQANLGAIPRIGGQPLMLSPQPAQSSGLSAVGAPASKAKPVAKPAIKTKTTVPAKKPVAKTKAAKTQAAKTEKAKTEKAKAGAPPRAQ